jgi:hypothetical protein
MTEERDPKVSAAYRELGDAEPPRALDDAILAAARREAGARPGFAGRASPQRWYAPLATAAVLVLAVALTLHTRVEGPALEAPAPVVQVPAKPTADVVAKAAPESARPKAAAPAKSAEPRAFVPDPAPPAAPTPAIEPLAQVPAARQAASAAGAAAPAADERPGRADLARDRARPLAAAESMAKRAEAPALVETPERELERIADLRRQERHEEADKALAEFRKRHPDFRIPDALRERVERR